MYCGCCGNKLKDGEILCPKCGKKADLERNPKQPLNPVMKKRPIIILGVVCALFLIITALTTMIILSQSLTNTKVKKLIKQNQFTYLYVNGENVYFTPSKIKVIAKEKLGKKTYGVVCTIQMSASDYVAQAEYEVIFRKSNTGWQISNYELHQVMDIQPLKGIGDLTEEEIANSIRRAYPEIDWNYERLALFGKNYNYLFPISYQLVDRKTELSEKKDTFLYQYSFDTFTGHESGQVQVVYNFTTEGNWVQTEANIINSEFTWNLEGIWDFDIYTYYVNIDILNMDFENHIATIVAKGSVWEGYGDPETLEVYFTEQDGCIYFDTFYLEEDEWSDGKEITLTAKQSDMYYKCPSLFSATDLYDMSIGGKTE